ncbi:helix-turn-helix domain-containing protein [Lactiplantibacillus modestisalitolerans]|uniref:Helix-turn-helix domain-containing protein n=1 Tax=Lactiplantibacillus modestisalitolerans TaxID=1457219 RepID=A0ABV5WRN2_9LACO|nr:helix-turn-helix transcriptional regulator [Lactiplantibacillus modestisalitolerans]
MNERATKELLHAIKTASNVDQFMPTLAPSFTCRPPAEYLAELLQVKQLTKSQVIRQANLTPATGYQYFDGKRRPSRARMIALGFGFGLGLSELNTMLKRTGYATLYAKDEWDALVIFGLVQRYDLNHTDDLLFQYGLGTITADN